MPLIRLVLLLGIAGILVLFALQNWGPALPIVFLSVSSGAMPLAFWVLAAFAAGLVTSLVLSGLAGIAGFVPRRRRRVRPRATAAAEAFGEEPPASRFSYPPPPPPSAAPREPEPVASEPSPSWQDTSTRVQTPPPPAAPRDDDRASASDWEEEDASDWFEDDKREEWEWEEERPKRQPASERQERQDEQPSWQGRNYEAPQEPKRVSRSGSVYSYSYREQDKPKAGRPDSVVDADYRVIVPPYRPPETEDGEDDFR